jgi:hypothetical protein
MLDADAIETFVRNGYIPLRRAVPPGVIEACQADVEEELRTRGVDPDDPSTWKVPVVRFWCPDTHAFAEAGTQPALWSAYDQLLGSESWWRREGVGGSIPVRFPHVDDPGDAGWHIDGSFDFEGDYGVNFRSKGRGLLALFLLSDVSKSDAPTELKVGSHLDVPRILQEFGDAGVAFGTASRRLPASTFERPSAFATGDAGDVFICHPFLVHRATWPHRGSRPRAIAQPGVAIHEPFRLDGAEPCPVERAILQGLSAN